jgi:hypothetical protein
MSFSYLFSQFGKSTQLAAAMGDAAYNHSNNESYFDNPLLAAFSAGSVY